MRSKQCHRVEILAILVIALSLSFIKPLEAAEEPLPMRIVASVVGPRNLNYLPMDIIPAIGADKAEGAQLILRHADGGGIVLKELANHNSDFAVTGLPAQMDQQTNTGNLVIVAAITDLPLTVFVVRKELQNEVKRPADLKGRLIGTLTSTFNANTTSVQVAKLFLLADGLQPHEVRFIPTGQDWSIRESMFRSGKVDAMVTEEPFATRLVETGLAFELANTMNPKDADRIPGGSFLFSTIATRQDVVKNNPEMVARMVRMLKRSLKWLNQHTHEEIVAKSSFSTPEEKLLLLKVLDRYPRIFSPDGQFSSRQLRETEIFFRAASPKDPATPEFQLSTIVNDQWAGRRE